MLHLLTSAKKIQFKVNNKVTRPPSISMRRFHDAFKEIEVDITIQKNDVFCEGIINVNNSVKNCGFIHIYQRNL